jgi:CubicO group peptidase (beta-lactamase class C family)
MRSRRGYIEKIVLLLLIFAMILPGMAFGQDNIYMSVEETAQELAGILLDTYGVTGLQYALVSEGNLVVSGTAGVFSKSEETPLTNETMFGIGSVSKMFTTVAIMQLQDQGKLDLDEAVVNYIPEFRMNDERYRDITVRMLLNHSSGLMGSTYINGVLCF